MAAACAEERDVVGVAKRFLRNGRELNLAFVLLDGNNGTKEFAGRA